MCHPILRLGRSGPVRRPCSGTTESDTLAVERTNKTELDPAERTTPRHRTPPENCECKGVFSPYVEPSMANVIGRCVSEVMCRSRRADHPDVWRRSRGRSMRRRSALRSAAAGRLRLAGVIAPRSAAVHGGRSSVGVSLCTRPRVALARRTCLGLGDSRFNGHNSMPVP